MRPSRSGLRERLRLLRRDPAGVAAARPARLSVDVPESSGTVGAAVAILLTHPQIKMPAVTAFTDAPVPFRRQGVSVRVITIGLRAVSGFHALVGERHDSQAHHKRGGRASGRLRQTMSASKSIRRDQ